MNEQTFADALRSQQELRFQFVVAELDLATTYSEIALDTAMDERFRRCSRLAYLAYETAIRFLPRCSLTVQKTLNVNDRLHKLHLNLKKLGLRGAETSTTA